MESAGQRMLPSLRKAQGEGGQKFLFYRALAYRLSEHGCSVSSGGCAISLNKTYESKYLHECAGRIGQQDRARELLQSDTDAVRGLR